MLFGIIILALVVSALLGRVNDRLDDPQGAISYNRIAHALLWSHSLSDEDQSIPAFYRRPPMYPIFLAFVYSLIGERFAAVVLFNMVCWVLALVLLWRLSRRYLVGLYAFLPSLMLALYWGGATYVFRTNTEPLSLFFSILIAFLYTKFLETGLVRFAAFMGLGLAMLILTKSVFLYLAIPALLCIFFLGKSGAWRAALVFFVVVMVPVGLWSLYSWHTFGTFQISSIGGASIKRVSVLELSRSNIAKLAISTFVGDYVTDALFPGYASDPRHILRVQEENEHKYYLDLVKEDRSNLQEAETVVNRETIERIKRQPLLYVATSFLYALRLHMPPNLNGWGLARTFVNTHSNISQKAKVAFLLSAFALWWSFIVLVCVGFWRMFRHRSRTSAFILFAVIYTSAVYALVSHDEVRYILPVMPFYFIAAVYAVVHRYSSSARS